MMWFAVCLLASAISLQTVQELILLNRAAAVALQVVSYGWGYTQAKRDYTPRQLLGLRGPPHSLLTCKLSQGESIGLFYSGISWL